MVIYPAGNAINKLVCRQDECLSVSVIKSMKARLFPQYFEYDMYMQVLVCVCCSVRNNDRNVQFSGNKTENMYFTLKHTHFLAYPIPFIQLNIHQ